ncbi:protein slowmo isoform X2 [Hyalella azteca]|uniref:Protein slowmo isoform X2 n=1 Tax=Hyalella azteca TaxID=294128 RepID=A0A8B7N1B1_HYAAZ|nr:protein slowmo isoform X2 [Hyalella azteca]
MKIWKSEYVFNHPWETVSEAVWRKYPNPHKPEIMGTDILDRQIDSGVLRSQRLIASRFGLPVWSRKILGTEDICYGFETSEVNPGKQMMSCTTKNLTFSHTVTMLERMVYRAAPPAPGSTQPRTVMEQEFTVTVHGIPLASYLEDTILGSLARNAFKGREAMEWTIDNIKKGWPSSASTTQETSCSEINASKVFNLAMVDEMSDIAKKSVDEFSELAIKSVDELSGKALKSVDEFSGKALKSVDEFSGKALKSVDEFSGKALKSVDEFSGKALKSVRHERHFDELFNLFL